jgi:uncharacterized protein (DUF58 family)
MRYCLSEVSYKRYLKTHHVGFGEETDLTIEVSNAKPLPLAWLQTVDDFPEEVKLLTPPPETSIPQDGRLNVLINLLSLSWYERVRRTYRIQGVQRGEFEFGPARISSGDIFGFYRQSMSEPAKEKLIVYPKVVPVNEIGLIPAWPLVEMKTPYRLLADPLRMASVREYVPGDSYRHIHWKATARLRTLMTKEFDPGASPVVLLFTDVQTNANPYTVDQDYLELIITSTASIALHGLDNKRGVGLYTNGGIGSSSRCARISASRHAAQATRILEILARVDEFRQMSMATLLYREMTSLPYGSTIIVLTALPTEELQQTLLQIQRIGHPVTLLTVGEEKLRTTNPIPTHHLGGRDVWRHLETLDVD